jgi:putative tryptophan/tyrosine transport system substrate-binding protein
MGGARAQRGLSRRRFVQGAGVASLGLLAGCGGLSRPPPASAKVPHIGYLAGGAARSPSEEAFLEGLRELGYVEGQSIRIAWRFADGQAERLPQLVAELLSVPVDLMLTSGPSATMAAKQATAVLPLVMCFGGEPIEQGLIASLARPGGNVTGFAALTSELSAKRLELFSQALPGTSRVAVLWDASAGAADRARVAGAAQTLGLTLQGLEVRAPEEIAGAFEAASGGRAEGVFVAWDPMSIFNAQRRQIADLGVRSGLPVTAGTTDFAEAGVLMTYGANFPSMYRRAASHVDKILKGTQPATLPVEQPTTFDFVINRKTAQALGLTIPDRVLLQATELIQ